MPVPAVITYEGLPPSSGGAHALKTRDPLVALEQVEAFMAACAQPTAPATTSVCLVRGESVPHSFFGPLDERFTHTYGAATLQRLGPDVGHRWTVPREDVGPLVSLTASLCPLPPHPHGLPPLCVEVDLRFHLKAPASGAELPMQGGANYLQFEPGYAQVLGESRLYARVSGKTTVSLFLNFPFGGPTADFALCKAHVQEHLPFMLSQKHWKLWRLTRKEDGYVGRKLQVV